MTAEEPLGYPHHLVGAPAPPPEAVAPRVFDMALRAHERFHAAAPAGDEDTFTAAPWRSARAVDGMFATVDAIAPRRSRASDGRIGNAAHAKLGKGSDHNAWLIYRGMGIVRAGDVTNDPVLNLPALFEFWRAEALAGRLPQLLNGGYLIINGRITNEDFTGWHEYLGANKHVTHGHGSVSLNPAQFDLPARWPALGARPAPTPPPLPLPPARPGWTGPDLTGSGSALRGDQGDNGPRVQAWQRWLARTYPAYRHACGALTDDGYWGPVTSRWNREFAHRSGIRSADGVNIGPQLAAAYRRAGLFRPLSAAQARVVGHLGRSARR